MPLAAACDVVRALFCGEPNGYESVITDLSVGEHGEGENPAQYFQSLHHQVFALHIFPFGNVYVSDSLMAGGELGSFLADLYSDAAFRPPADVTPDHFGIQFAAAGFILLTAVEYWRHGDRDGFLRTQSQLSQLIHHALIPSLIPVSAALVGERAGFAANFSQILCPLALEVAAAAGVSGLSPRPEHDIPSEDLPSADSGLTRLVRYLMTPVHCGFWLGAGDIRTLAARLSLPCGFSTREDMLTNLMHAAGTYDQVPQVLAAVADIAEKRAQDLSRWHSLKHGTILESIVHRTESRLTRTIHLLEQFKQHATRGYHPN